MNTVRNLFRGCIALVVVAATWAQTTPAERPRARPPSMLTGRAEWEKANEMFAKMAVPPAPPLSPEEALKTFRVAPGFRLELVAAEPMVQNPVFFEFDPEGRIWVAEFQGYMRDLKGAGEGDPICRVVVLEDTDGDGRMDKSTVFLEGLVMPRSFAFVKGGLLLQEPPKLWFCEDLDGDLRCDRRTEVGRLGAAGNPQHTANGLRYGIDNWLHNADATTRVRWLDGRLIEQAVPKSGQFGVSFDEMGRFLTCRESSALRANLIPAEYISRNPQLASLVAAVGRGGTHGIDTDIATEAQRVYPIRVTPGITLGAMELGDDGRLRTYTVASGSCYYDGDQFGEEARGNVFVPEAGGNLIGRLKLSSGVRPKAARYYPAEQEFLASTDERFRPVNARVGPDGALYIADLYRGIIEHVIFLVPWINEQVRARKLDLGQNQGRIYRMVREDRPIDRRAPAFSRAPSSELVARLSHATGWWRLTAQRLLVERRDPSVVVPLRELALRGENPLGRLHALWTLDGCGGLDAATKFAALNDADERVRAAAIRLCERGLDASEQVVLLEKLKQIAADRSDIVRFQATLTASSLPQRAALSLVTRLVREGDDPLFRTAALTGLGGRELELVRLILAESRNRAATSEGEAALLVLAARCVLEAENASRLSDLMDTLAIAGGPAQWQQATLLEAVSLHVAVAKRRGKPLALAREPTALLAIAGMGDTAVRTKAAGLVEVFTWPGARLGLEAAGEQPLTPEESKRITIGRDIYANFCAPCHQLDGSGAAGMAPPLAGSDWVSGPPERIVRIVLHGLYGPVRVNGQTWNLVMPGIGSSGALDDEKISAVLTYVRQAWGNRAPGVDVAQFAALRRNDAARTLPWTAEELLANSSSAGSSAAIEPQVSGEFLLSAKLAKVFGQRLGYRAALDVLAPWTVADDIAEWHVAARESGEYQVQVTLAADADSAGDFYVVETEGSRTRAEVRSTENYETFRAQPAGKLRLRAGVNRIILRPNGPLKRELADVRGIRLVPVGKR